MSETRSPHFFFSEAEILQRVFIVYGNLSDYYITPSNCWLSFDRAVASHLKHMGYEVVIAFNGTEYLECFDPNSAAIRRQKIKTQRETNEDKTKEKRDASPENKDGRTVGGPMSRLNMRPRKTSDISKSEEDSAPLRFADNAEHVPEYLDQVMRNKSSKTALVFCNCTSLFDGHREDGKSVNTRELANRMSRWYGLPAENENIAVMLFDIPRIVTLHDTMRSQQMWNFLFERAFNGDSPTDAVIHIGGPNLDEIRYLLTDNIPAYVSHNLLRKINPTYTRQGLESAAQLMIQHNHGSLKSLQLFIKQHPTDAVDVLMRRYGASKENALEKIQKTEGWEAVYEAVSRIVNTDKMTRDDFRASVLPQYNDTNLRMAHEQEVSSSSANLSMILCGNPGTGKTTVVRYIASVFKQAGLLPSDQVFKVTRDDLVGSHIGETALKTKSRIEEAMGAVLFVDEAYSLYREGHDGGDGHRDFGIEAIDTLLEAISDRRGRISIIFAGYPKDMKYFLTANPGLPRRFDGNIITIQDYRPDLLERIFLRSIHQMNLTSQEDSIPENISFVISDQLGASSSGNLEPKAFIEKDIEDRKKKKLSPISVFFDNWYADRDKESFGNAGAAEELARHVMETAQQRMGIEDGEIPIEQCDFGEEFQKFFINRKPSIEDLQKQLDDIVGMQEVKEALSKVVSYLQTARMRETFCNNPDLLAEPGHYLFVGNPGTGKTMISEKLGMALCSMGMIQRYKPVRRTGLDLINTVTMSGGIRRLKEEIEGYNRGVLVIDEAHQLSDPASSGAGSIVIKCLLDPMIEHRKEFSVVFCCYPKQMERLLQMEEGLRRRISSVFIFQDYTPEEIRRIFVIKAQKAGYILSDEVIEAVETAFVAMHDYPGGSLLENGASAEKMMKEIEVSMGIRLQAEFSSLNGISDPVPNHELQLRLFTVERSDVEDAAVRMISALSTKNGGAM